MSNTILINLVPVETGGGLQNALSLVGTLGERDCLVLCKKGSRISQECRNNGVQHEEVESRFFFEAYSAVRRFGKNKTCFTLFGAPPHCSTSYWTNISGCAYSNLFYPELDFWGYLPLLRRKFKQTKDRLRLKTMLSADAWVFETEVLSNRAIEQGFEEERVFHVPMAVSRLVASRDCKHVEISKSLGKKDILYLGAAHPNKRQHLLFDLARFTNELVPNIRFITTMDQASAYAKSVIREFEIHGMSDSILNIGPVDPSSVANLIDSTDGMILLSALESFSNNFVEAWSRERPLFVTDADWSRAACRNGAHYLNLENLKECAAGICEVLSTPQLVASLVAKGSAVLSTYPSALEKTTAYFSVIEKVRALGKCPMTNKSRIRH